MPMVKFKNFEGHYKVVRGVRGNSAPSQQAAHADGHYENYMSDVNKVIDKRRIRINEDAPSVHGQKWKRHE